MADILGMADEAGPDDHWEPPAPSVWREPAPLAVFALVSAFLSLMGNGVFRGTTYTALLADPTRLIGGEDSGSSGINWLVVGAFVSVVLALLPMIVGLSAHRRLLDEDPDWVPVALRAAVLLAGLSATLHLIAAVLVATNADASGISLYL